MNIRGAGLKLRRFFEIPFLYKNWIEILIKRKDQSLLSLLRLRSGLNFYTGNIPSARPIVSHSFSKKEGYDIFQPIKEKDIVVDIGAFIGDFSIKVANEGAIVYAFEPFKEVYNILIKNIKANNLKGKIIPFNLGVYNFSGKEVLNIRKNYGVNSMLGKEIGNSPIIKEEIIDVITFKEMVNKLKLDKIDFLKIDAEGVEAEIVLAIPPKFLKIIKYISMESTDYKNSGKNNILINYLKENNFELKVFRVKKELNRYDIVRIFAKNGN